MALYIDPPAWPAHGTLFSHLVSDASVEELQAFAERAGLPPRAFDRDHYDVPERRYAQLVALGAIPVSGRELARRLIRSGVRVPARQRDEKLDGVLRRRWDALGLGGPGRDRSAHRSVAVRDELLRRWSEPHRHYHGRSHLLAVLTALDTLAAADGTTDRTFLLHVRLAAWFHDAVYDGVPGQDEEASAALAVSRLPGLSPAVDAAEVARLVRTTARHAPAADDAAGRLLCDADLEVLARPWAEYQRYTAQVRRDYAHVADPDFAVGRAAVLRGLLGRDPLFGTAAGRRLWESAARTNLLRELAALGSAGPEGTAGPPPETTPG
ncbi:DUF4031 domain-containing protein [Zhihengliuella sp.]|uniref:DUF4031 domain-containing protein n=1 Tax=Zhihengliuella sp. TaxID=1954483 RepID=UPI0028112FAB|nr:DUF4031 domain-containing protein [Zhihengliuella sp.]